ncbi:MAG: hypothetical protein ACYC5G_04365 [Candidatus Doudnabacteria bacterium]
MYELSKSKSHDYSGFVDGVFGNFEVVEQCGITSVEVGFLTRMMDKISRVNSFVKQGVCLVTDEKITDSLMDLSNYCILLSAYITDKKQKQ